MRTTLRKLLVHLLRGLLNLFGARWRWRVGALLREAMSSNGYDEIIHEVPTPRGTVRFFCLGPMSLWRAQTALTKEPETIEWIDTMREGEVLFDIGANVGVYTLYAAINRKVKVMAFEPLAANYFLLNRNIEENGLSDVATAYCVALNDQDMVSTLHIQNTGFGSALSSFDDPVDHLGQRFAAKFQQGMVGMSLDSFIEKFQPEFPNFIKIDVGGIEDKIIKGMAKTLADPRLRSLSIELDEGRPAYTNGVIAAIEAAGLKLVAKRHAPMMDNGPYSRIYNYQFYR